ncbi:MAG: ferredoxin, partial [Euryarchaeota archaeon]|nr:ferredoxin [Euryarchaeota archaeon]
MTIVAKVWIEEDCITCDACQDICPEVFLVSDDSSKILAAVRTDGVLDRNVGGASMAGSFGSDYGEMILEAADACPVEIIKFELQTDGATETVAEVAPAAEVAA